MKSQAEKFAKEDEEKKSQVESKNRLDATIFTGEKMLQDAKDKLKDEDKKKITEALEKAKKVLVDEKKGKADFDQESESLSQIIQTVGTAMHQQAAGPEPGAAPEAEADSSKADSSGKDQAEEGEVVDGEDNKK